MNNQLEYLKQFTTVVADTGDFATLKQYAPRDATTNPSLILKAAQMPEHRAIVKNAVSKHRNTSLPARMIMDNILDDVLVAFGLEILKVVPGRVSTETDARIAFDTEALIEKGRRLIAIYERNGIDRERVLIKIATTWEGICAAEKLQKEGINCNLTLLFSLVQAVACAEANCKLISPFVGHFPIHRGRCPLSGASRSSADCVAHHWGFDRVTGNRLRTLAGNHLGSGGICCQ